MTETVINTEASADRHLLAEIEAFFTHEAHLLDEWRLEEWLQLLTADVQYFVPPLNIPDASPDTAVFLVVDDHVRLASRVRQLLSGSAWVENPRSRTRRMVTNARIDSVQGSEVRASANFAIWRIHMGQVDIYPGRYKNLFVRDCDGLKIKERWSILDLESLNPHGKVSIIL